MKKRIFLGALSILIITFLAIWGYGGKVKPMLRLKELADDMKQDIHLTVRPFGFNSRWLFFTHFLRPCQMVLKC